ncbi:recombinase family protein [Frankia sp. CNm7]|uniref:Recombinase family protein n=2 Tax=Frankia nepalensis TaxID=1836974 RepID=A0A937RHY9_9ACTN|nr:recombinase family protein [Frankia nepalensis]MBL7499782.1 recombinase family protein [Frankia nepalensis]MBL7512267.1 recombinase family protein [Frankia nepalensis]MBL7520448.1 recombinase family protein [Frankia nepalensis]MBL7632583.1 recombinase family protein [Frankia nepalensis]
MSAAPEPAKVVYGYISLEHADEAEIDRLHDQLARHARAEGLALAEVFVDRCVPPGRIVRPGLTVLLETVRRSEASGVLVMDVDHLSPLPAVRRAIEVEVETLGAQVFTATAPPAGHSQADPRTRAASPSLRSA